jgi:hypothetical protein
MSTKNALPVGNSSEGMVQTMVHFKLPRRASIVAVILCGTAAALSVAAAPAGAPPAPGGTTAVIAGPGCIRYGQSLRVRGSGFTPGSTILVDAPEGHYTGPFLGPDPIRSKKVEADPSGGFDVKLKILPPGSGLPAWQAKVVLVTEMPQPGVEASAQSYDQVVIGTHRVCRFLDGAH